MAAVGVMVMAAGTAGAMAGAVGTAGAMAAVAAVDAEAEAGGNLILSR